MDSNGKRVYFNAENEEGCRKKFKLEHDSAMGYVQRLVEPAPKKDALTWESYKRLFLK